MNRNGKQDVFLWRVSFDECPWVAASLVQRYNLTSRAECFRQRLVLRLHNLGLFLIESFTINQLLGRCTEFIAFKGSQGAPLHCPSILSGLGGESRDFGAHSSETVACRMSSGLFRVLSAWQPWSSGLHFDGQSSTWQLFLYILQGSVQGANSPRIFAALGSELLLCICSHSGYPYGRSQSGSGTEWLLQPSSMWLRRIWT